MAWREVPRRNRKANLVVQLARGRDIAVLLNVEPHARVAQAVRATLRIFVPGDNCNPGISGCAGREERFLALYGLYGNSGYVSGDAQMAL